MSAALLSEIDWLVDLNALLDLRLGALYVIDPNAVIAVLDNGWHTRTNDKIIEDVGGVTLEVLQKTLINNPIECAKNAFPTFINKYLMERIAESHREEMVAQEFNKHHITVNTYPLALKEDERRDLVDIVMEMIPVIYSVEVISVAPHFITPLYLKGKHQFYITYNFFEWIKLYDLQLNATPIPEVAIIAPKLMELDPEVYYEGKVPDYDEEVGPWAMFGAAWSPFLNVRFEDIRWFSSITEVQPT